MDDNNNESLSISKISFKDKFLVKQAEQFSKYLNKRCGKYVEEGKIKVYLSEEYEDTVDVIFATKNEDKIREKAVNKVMESMVNYINENMTDDDIPNKNNGVEIIPLEGYSTKYLKEDIKIAANKKRTLCIVDTYDNYYRFTCGKILKIKHFNITPDDDSYSDIVTYCLTEDINKIKELYFDKLKESVWLD